VIGVISGGRQIGGSEIICLSLAEWLYERGVDVWLHIGSGGEDQITARARECDVRLIDVHDLRKTCRRSRAIFLYGTKLLGQQATLADRINEAGGPIFAFVGGFGDDYVTPVYLHVDSYWCETEAVRNYFVGQGVPSWSFVVCRIPVAPPAGIEPIRLFPDDTFTFGVVARLIRRKLVGQAVCAFKKLDMDHCRLVIVGDGPERGELEKLIDNDERIVLTGLVEDPTKMWGLLRGFDCLVQSSLWEGCSRVIREAMALGVPVIASDGFFSKYGEIWPGGNPEIVFPGRTGMLYPVNNIDALTRRMTVMATNRSRGAGLARGALKFITADNIVSGVRVLDLLNA